MHRKSLTALITILQLLLIVATATPVFAVDNGVVSGSVYHDVNGNAQAEVGEPNLPDATVYVEREGDAAPKSIVTDAEGYFVLTDLAYGRYRLWAEDSEHHRSSVQYVALDEVNGASIVELPIVFDLSNDIQYLNASTIFLPYVNR